MGGREGGKQRREGRKRWREGKETSMVVHILSSTRTNGLYRQQNSRIMGLITDYFSWETINKPQNEKCNFILYNPTTTAWLDDQDSIQKSKITQWVKELDTKSKDPSPVPRTHSLGGRKEPTPWRFLWPLQACYTGTHAHTLKYTHNKNVSKSNSTSRIHFQECWRCRRTQYIRTWVCSQAWEKPHWGQPHAMH